MDPYLFIIVSCYLIIAIIWIANAFSNKRTEKRAGGWGLRITAIIVVLFFIFIQKLPFFGYFILPKTNVIMATACALTILGTCLMIWARFTLGKNWSADITLKQDHKIIVSGPYAIVRHPIYTGLILIVLGLVFYVGNVAFMIFFVTFFFGALYKAKKEERLLIDNFPSEYLGYKRKVKSLIPFLF